MASAWDIERELTYDIAAGHEIAVHRVLVPESGVLVVGGVPFRARLRPANLVLHVYTRHDDNDRRRVLIELTDPPRIRLSEKRWGLDGGEPVKFDRRRWITEAEAWDELAGRRLTAFVKARFPVALASGRTGASFRVRIDAMTPVDGTGSPRPEHAFAQVEIEARSEEWDPASIEHDRLLWSHLEPWLTPATRTKADLAGAAGTSPGWSVIETAARVHALIGSAGTLAAAAPSADLMARHRALLSSQA